jgi:hypothetical protein
MRTYYDRRGRARGYSLSGKEALVADSLLGFCIWATFFLIALPFRIFGWILTSPSVKNEWRVLIAGAYATVLIVAVVVALSSNGPRNQPVSARSVPSWTCADDGGVARAVETYDDSGDIYATVTCKDGVYLTDVEL